MVVAFSLDEIAFPEYPAPRIHRGMVQKPPADFKASAWGSRQINQPFSRFYRGVQDALLKQQPGGNRKSG